MKSYEQGWNDGIDAAKEALGCRGGGYSDFVLDRRKKPEVERCPYRNPDCPRCNVSEPVITRTFTCDSHCGGIDKICANCTEVPKPKMAFFVRKNGAIFEARPFSFTTPGQASCLGMGAEIRFQLIAPNVYLEL